MTPARQAGALASVLVTVAAGGMIGCGDDAPAADPIVVTLDDRPVRRSELQAYLSFNLPELQGEAAAEAVRQDPVRSRLFDNFIDEELLLLEAERRGVTVSRTEIERRLAEDEAGAGEVSPGRTGDRRAVRRQIMIQKLRAAVSFAEVTITEREIDRYLSEHRARTTGDRRVVLRFLTFKDEREANRIRLEILRTGLGIDEAIEVFSTDRSRTGPLELDLEVLPEEISRVIAKLQPGEFSRPVLFHGKAYLFALQARVGDGDEAALRARARRELTRAETRQALEALTRKLRDQTRIVVEFDNLPFRYAPAR